MFVLERFTDHGRKIMSFAQQEAGRFNHHYIDTEHILLGLINERTCIGANILENLGEDLEKIRAKVENLMKVQLHIVAVGPLPYTPRAKFAIEYAIDEARQLDHSYVGSEHILLGLMRKENGVPSREDSIPLKVFEEAGLTIEMARKEVLDYLGREDTESNEPVTKVETPPKKESFGEFAERFLAEKVGNGSDLLACFAVGDQRKAIQPRIVKILSLSGNFAAARKLAASPDNCAVGRFWLWLEIAKISGDIEDFKSAGKAISDIQCDIAPDYEITLAEEIAMMMHKMKRK